MAFDAHDLFILSLNRYELGELSELGELFGNSVEHRCVVVGLVCTIVIVKNSEVVLEISSSDGCVPVFKVEPFKGTTKAGISVNQVILSVVAVVQHGVADSRKIVEV